MRVLETAQQYLALVLGECRMTSNQGATFFFFSPGYSATQNTPGLRRGGINVFLRAWSVFSRMASLKGDGRILILFLCSAVVCISR